MAKWKTIKRTVPYRLPEDSSYVVVTPAYGKDYPNQVEAIHAWLEGQDFIHQPSGRYCSDRDYPAHMGVQIRFKKGMEVAVIDPEPRA